MANGDINLLFNINIVERTHPCYLCNDKVLYKEKGAEMYLYGYWRTVHLVCAYDQIKLAFNDLRKALSTRNKET